MTRILIVDDHSIMRDGLRALLEKEEGMSVVAEAGDGRSAVELALEHRPDVVVMDVGLPELNGVEATRRIVRQVPGVKVLGLSMHAEMRFVAEMLRAGASGYLLKDSAFDELARAIRTVSQGHRYLGQGIMDDLLDDYIRRLERREEKTSFSTLTEREREVLQLLAEGRSTKETAQRLEVSVKTVETHRANLMRKLGLSSIAELTRYAIREGLVSLE
jgi:DNA-binding NarL/FixJ family response regulator